MANQTPLAPVSSRHMAPSSRPSRSRRPAGRRSATVIVTPFPVPTRTDDQIIGPPGPTGRPPRPNPGGRIGPASGRIPYVTDSRPLRTPSSAPAEGARRQRAVGPSVTTPAALVSAALVAGLLAGYGIAVPVGAIAVLIVGLTARAGLRTGAAAALGVAMADGLYALVAVLGGSAVAGLIAPWRAPAVGGGRGARGAGGTHGGGPAHYRDPARAETAAACPRPGRAYLGFLGLTLLNPMTIVYFGALVLGRRAGGDLGAMGSAVFVLAVLSRRRAGNYCSPAAAAWSAGCSPARAGGWAPPWCPASSSSASRSGCRRLVVSPAWCRVRRPCCSTSAVSSPSRPAGSSGCPDQPDRSGPDGFVHRLLLDAGRRGRAARGHRGRPGWPASGVRAVADAMARPYAPARSRTRFWADFVCADWPAPARAAVVARATELAYASAAWGPARLRDGVVDVLDAAHAAGIPVAVVATPSAGRPSATFSPVPAWATGSPRRSTATRPACASRTPALVLVATRAWGWPGESRGSSAAPRCATSWPPAGPAWAWPSWSAPATARVPGPTACGPLPTSWWTPWSTCTACWLGSQILECLADRPA